MEILVIMQVVDFEHYSIICEDLHEKVKVDYFVMICLLLHGEVS